MLADLQHSLSGDVMTGLAQAAGAIVLCLAVILLCRRFTVHVEREAVISIGRGLVQIYRHTFSPLIGFHCRHLPTCSEYADQALDRFGLWAGSWMTLARLVRCQPFGTSGLDFVPDAAPAKARWYLPWRYGRWRGTNAGATR